MKKQSKLLIGIIAAIAVLAVVVISIIMAAAGGIKDTYNSHMELAQRYLDELQYEQAIAEYETAITIDPKNEDAYLGLVDVYVAMGNTEKALEVLAEGYAQTQSERIAEWQEKLATERLSGAKTDNTAESEATGQEPVLDTSTSQADIIQWEAVFSPSEEKAFEEILEAFSEGTDEEIEDALINSTFISLVKQYGYKNGTEFYSIGMAEHLDGDVYELDYGDTVNGEGITFEVTIYDEGYLCILAYYGNWENGMADGYGKLIKIGKTEEDFIYLTTNADVDSINYVPLTFEKAEGTWVDGFADGDFQYTEHDVTNKGYYNYDTITGSLKHGVWEGEVVRNTYGNATWGSYEYTIYSTYMEGIVQKIGEDPDDGWEYYGREYSDSYPQGIETNTDALNIGLSHPSSFVMGVLPYYHVDAEYVHRKEYFMITSLSYRIYYDNEDLNDYEIERLYP